MKKWHAIGVDVVDGDGYCIADCSASGRIPFEKMQENAKLIAAAPELLEACNKALGLVILEVPTYDMLLNAINKATK